MHIYLFSPIRYDFLNQRPQKLAAQFRALSNTVTYIQPSSVREHLAGNPVELLRALMVSAWYHLLALFALLLPSLQRKATSSSLKEDTISLPLTIPPNKFNSPFVEMVAASVYRQFLVRCILRDGDNETSIAIFENPFWGRVVERGDFNIVCYDCLDDVVLYAGNASLERFHSYEDELIAKSDFVDATAARLEADLRKKHFPQPVYRIPNGVEYDWFRNTAASAGVPADLASLKRPLVGYVGHLAGWTDYELVGEVAKQMPEVSFVFVGPVESRERRIQLQTGSNIFWLDKKPYAEIPKYVHAFDVCIIPFKQGSIAETTNPVKIFEYFALGKPVVTTPMNELIPFAEKGLVKFGNSPGAFVEAVTEALADTDPGRREQRMQVAQRFSWRNHARSFIDAIRTAEANK